MNKILTFIIGLLCGAIISILCFMLYLKSFQLDMMNPNNEMYKPREEMKEPPKMPNGNFQEGTKFNR